jgi:flagellar biosynthesis/type III secretory pathway protein FliH
LSRVIHNATIATPPAFGRDGLEFIDASTADLVDRARAEAFDAGRREGFAAGKAEVQGAVGRLESAVRDAVRRLGDLRAADIEQTLSVALEIASFVVGRLPPDEGGTLARRISDAVSKLDDENVVVAVHPQDWDAVRDGVRLPNGVTMERDPSLAPGEARVAGRWATAELTREAALQVAREVLL